MPPFALRALHRIDFIAAFKRFHDDTDVKSFISLKLHFFSINLFEKYLTYFLPRHSILIKYRSDVKRFEEILTEFNCEYDTVNKFLYSMSFTTIYSLY